MRICAVACAMNRHELLQTSMTHLVLNGISDFYLFDHGSDPDLAGVLSDAFGAGGIRVTILRKETPHFFHAAMIGALTELARMDGFETVLAFDADEFWCSTVPDRTLADQISTEMTAGLAALRVPVVNFVQHRAVIAFTTDSLATCAYAVAPHLDATRPCREQVDAGMPFVAMPFPSKVIARLSRGIRFTEGQHGIMAPEGTGAEGEATGIVVRHLTLSSRDDLAFKREHGLRRIQAGFAPDTGWQLQRLAYMTDQDLDDYWDNNSWRLSEDQRVLVGSYDRLAEDGGLVEIGRDVAAAIDRLGASPNAEADRAPTVQELDPQRLERLLEGLVDEIGTAGQLLSERQTRVLAMHLELSAAQDELVASRIELERRARFVEQLQSDLADLAVERAAAESALSAIEKSASWRLTMPLRAIKRSLRPQR